MLKISRTPGQQSTWSTVVYIVTILLALLLVAVFVYNNGGAHKVIHGMSFIQKIRKSGAPKRVLVTGAAGFIGFHVAKHLAADSSINLVVGIDNFNDYYDVQLKVDRAYELSLAGVQMHYADLCDKAFLEDLFMLSNFTHVVHLGAQAGVRYSLDNPLAYVHSNMEGHQTVLDVIRNYPNIHLTYASSSSVYGKDSAIPFRLTANTDRPGNMYAATKRGNELMSFQHCSTSNIMSVGLRFFTVYGPWGRPDMAVYKFAESILDGKKVPMFHISDDRPLGRDFTYVDDIVTGILSAMDYEAPGCGAVFNLGYGNPVSVPNLISLLETELELKGEIDKLPLPPTEILNTWADIDVSKQELGFYPTIDLTAGIREFVKWFKDYRLTRQTQESTGLQSNSRLWFMRLKEDASRRTKYSI